MALTTAQSFYLRARRMLQAWFVRFDPTGTGLVATNVQDAIAELDAGAGGGGDVVGPASSVDGHVAVFDGATGKLLKDSSPLVTASGLTMSTDRLLGRSTASAGAVEEIELSGLSLAAGVLSVDGGDSGVIHCIIIACSDETTLLTTGLKVTFRMPYGFVLTDVRGSLTEAATGATKFAFDVLESGSSIFSTKPTFDASEKTTVTAAVPGVVFDNGLADDAEMTVVVDAVGSTLAGKGFKVALVGYRSTFLPPPPASVVLQFDMDGANLSTTILDLSTYAATQTAVNGAALSSGRTIFTNATMLFLDGTNDFVSSDQVCNIGAGPFTIEAHIRPTGNQTGRVISSQNLSTNALITLRVDAGGALTLIMRNESGGGTVVLSSAAGLVAMNDTVTYHIAATRNSSNDVNIWLNGVSVASTNSATNVTRTAPNQIAYWLGAQDLGYPSIAPTEFFKGYIGPARVVESVCLYTGTFTPPSANF
jgi:hypothetical protein